MRGPGARAGSSGRQVLCNPMSISLAHPAIARISPPPPAVDCWVGLPSTAGIVGVALLGIEIGMGNGVFDME